MYTVQFNLELAGVPSRDISIGIPMASDLYSFSSAVDFGELSDLKPGE